MRIILLLTVFGYCLSAFAQPQQAILLLKKDQQDAVFGFNIVKDIISLSEKAIRSGGVRLFADASRANVVSIAQLNALEKLAGFSIGDCKEIILYETWELDGKSTRYEPIGFQFGGINDSGQVFNLGFVAASELGVLLDSTYASVGAEGFYPVSLRQLLAYRQFQYELLSFRNKNARNTAEGRKAIKRYVANRGAVAKTPKIARNKVVAFLPDTNNDTTAFLRFALNALISDYTEDFLNIPSFAELGLRPNWKVSQIEITQSWSQKQGLVTQSVPTLKFIFENGQYVDGISISQLQLEETIINNISWLSMFSHSIGSPKLIHINFEKIPLAKERNYWRALYADWLNFNQNL